MPNLSFYVRNTGSELHGSHYTNTSPRLSIKAAQDPQYQELHSIIRNGFPAHRRQLPETCKPFWAVKEHLSIDDCLIVYECWLLIPRAKRPQVLADLQKSHQRTVRTKQRAHLTVYWPGIDNDIDNVIIACQLWKDHLPSNPKEPIVSKPKLLCPFQEVAADFWMYGGKQFLNIVDCYTDWPEIIPIGTNTTTHHLIIALRSTFCRMASLTSSGQLVGHSSLLRHFTRLPHFGT